MEEFSKPNKAAQDRFLRIALLFAPHHGLLAATSRTGLRSVQAIMSRHGQRLLRGSKLRQYPQARVAAYQDIASTAVLWHGTGRYQYRDGTPFDCLAKILTDGSLNPVEDVYALFIGGKEMVTLSATPHRVVARCYADMHGAGEHELHRYGSSYFWLPYFYGMFYVKLYLRSPLKMRRYTEQWKARATDEHGHVTWGRKVHSKAELVWEVFSFGSDIAGNYPVLFGIRQYGKTEQIAKPYQRAEVRIAEPVKITDLTHVEVPADKVLEVSQLLKKHGYPLPVFPIELGEVAMSRQPFSYLMGY